MALVCGRQTPRATHPRATAGKLVVREKIATLAGTVILLLAALSSLAAGQDDLTLLDNCWRVGSEGEVLVWPDELLTEGNLDFVPLFPATSEVLENPSEFLTSVGWGACLACALSASDLLAATDVDYHCRKLRLGTYPDLQLDALIRGGAPNTTQGVEDPLARRAQLDRILALRLAAERNVDWLPGSLTRILADADSDSFLQASAQHELDRLMKRAVTPVPWNPEALPDGYAVYACIDWRRIPAPQRLMRICNLDAARRVRELALCLGAAFEPTLLSAAQWRIDRRAELAYELVRRFGNVRLTWAWFAGRPTDSSDWRICARGRFEAEQLRRSLTDLSRDFRDDRGTLCFDVNGASIRASASSVEIGMPDSRTIRPATTALAEELMRTGFGEGDAVWAYMRDPTGIPFLERIGVDRLVLRASFTGGLTATVSADCRDESAASDLAKELETTRTRFASEIVRGAGEPGPASTRSGFTWALADPEAAIRFAALVRSIEIQSVGRRVSVRLHTEESVEGLYALIVAAWPK